VQENVDEHRQETGTHILLEVVCPPPRQEYPESGVRATPPSVEALQKAIDELEEDAIRSIVKATKRSGPEKGKEVDPRPSKRPGYPYPVT